MVRCPSGVTTIRQAGGAAAIQWRDGNARRSRSCVAEHRPQLIVCHLAEIGDARAQRRATAQVSPPTPLLSWPGGMASYSDAPHRSTSVIEPCAYRGATGTYLPAPSTTCRCRGCRSVWSFHCLRCHCEACALHLRGGDCFVAALLAMTGLSSRGGARARLRSHAPAGPFGRSARRSRSRAHL